MQSPSAPQPTLLPTIELAPNYRIPIVLVLAGIAIGLLANPWVGGPIGLLGLFLAFQTATLRLVFTDSALSVTRGGVEFRNFPYAEWQNWRIFWPAFPVLLYFKEINSIHFLPILFDPATLGQCLADRCPRIETGNSSQDQPE
jgi:hypothetical protein